MSFVPKNCKTAVFFTNTFERSSNAGYGANNVKTESETGVTIGASRLPYATVNGFREKTTVLQSVPSEFMPLFALLNQVVVLF